MEREGVKRLGRFFKRTDKLIKKISINSFSFEEIQQNVTVFPDNTHHTIFHARLHDPKELEKVIRAPAKFDDSLVDESRRNPVIKLRDFTEEWLRDKRRLRKRDDGDLDDEYEDEDFSDIRAMNSNSGGRKRPSNVKAQAKEIRDNIAESQTATPTGKEVISIADPQTNALSNGNKASEKAPKEAHTISPDKLTMVGRAIQDAVIHAPHADTARSKHESAAIKEEKTDFIPLDLKGPEGVAKIEEATIDKYHQQLEEQRLKEIESVKAAEKAKELGYQEGIKRGEEDARAKVREEAAQMFSRINELVIEFSKLKQTVLSNIEENFYELNQAIAESLLQREFNISKDAFASIVKRAVADSVPTDEFKIKVHPETYERLMKQELAELKSSLVKDESVKVDEFKIDSKLSSIQGNVKDIVKSLLEKIDINLFESSEKHEKAG